MKGKRSRRKHQPQTQKKNKTTQRKQRELRFERLPNDLPARLPSSTSRSADQNITPTAFQDLRLADFPAIHSGTARRARCGRARRTTRRCGRSAQRSSQTSARQNPSTDKKSKELRRRRSATHRICGVEISSRLHQLLDHSDIGSLRSQHQHCPAHLSSKNTRVSEPSSEFSDATIRIATHIISRIHVGSALQQVCDDAAVVLAHSSRQRAAASLQNSAPKQCHGEMMSAQQRIAARNTHRINEIHVSSCLHQELYHPSVATIRRELQHGLLALKQERTRRNELHKIQRETMAVATYGSITLTELAVFAATPPSIKHCTTSKWPRRTAAVKASCAERTQVTARTTVPAPPAHSPRT